jgi:PAS domain S-box-containing protein
MNQRPSAKPAQARLNERVRKSEARLQAAVDLVGLSIYSWNPVTGALEWDARLKGMWGLSPDAHVDENIWRSAIHPDDQARVAEEAERCIDPNGDGTYAIEYRVIGIEDCIERWVSTIGRTTFRNGQPNEFVGAALEITVRKRAEEALRDSEERFRRFAKFSLHVFWILDLNTMQLDYLSPAFERVWGEAPGPILASFERWQNTIHFDDRDRVLAGVQRVRAGGSTVQDYRIVRPDGSVRRIRDTLFPIRDGHVQRIGGIAQDVTKDGGSTIYIVSPDKASCSRLTLLLESAGYRVKSFRSASRFLDMAPVLASGSVLAQVENSQGEGLRISMELKIRRIGLPVIVVGDARGDVRFGAEIIKAGAADFLPIPYTDQQLLEAVAAVRANTHADDEGDRDTHFVRARIAEMSQRERDVLIGLLGGKTNKQIARDMGISPRTVEVHRAHVMQRLGAQSLPEAVLKAAAAGLQPLPLRDGVLPFVTN